MKPFISHADLMQVLLLLDLPADVLSVELRPRDEIITGVQSSWMLKATRSAGGGPTCAGETERPYTIETIYVPVLLPRDEERRRERLANPDRLRAERRHDRKVKHVYLPEDDSVIDWGSDPDKVQ